MNTWVNQPTVEQLQEFCANTMVDTIGIEFTAIGEDFLSAKMPVDKRTVQPARILHGGASVALAESLGSVAAQLCVDFPAKHCVGLSINASHVRGVKEGGVVYGTARPLHLGRSTHLWEIRVEDGEGRLICISRLTMAVLDA
ncbi:MAG: hotdog fold thioesterase [Deltaproteobacteria bacterium]|nr:hotdog fold thioesterase [Deltaproteobacteria bacterium]